MTQHRRISFFTLSFYTDEHGTEKAQKQWITRIDTESNVAFGQILMWQLAEF